MLFTPSRCTAKNLSEDDENTVCEPKLDGGRYLLYLNFNPYTEKEITTLLSRRRGDDGQFINKTLNVPHITAKDYSTLGLTVLDGECFLKDFKTTISIMNSSPVTAKIKQKRGFLIRFFVWDILCYEGEDVRRKPLSERRQILIDVVELMANESVIVLPQWAHNEIESKFNMLVKGGGEGLILKDIRLAYGLGWQKKKKSYEVSCFISGFKNGTGKYDGMVGSIAISVFDGKKIVEVGFASGFSEKIRMSMTRFPKSYLGKVVDIFAHEISLSNRLRHPTFYRFRPDMSDDECTIEKLKEDLKNNLRDNRKK